MRRHPHNNGKPRLRMLYRFRNTLAEYDPQFWLMVTGIFISTAGASMIMPFLMIYATGKLGIPLSQAVTLISINAGTSLFSSFIAGSLADRVGRKLAMNVSLTISGLTYLGMRYAITYPTLAALMVAIGFANAMYSVGADAMMADLVPSEKRADAYAINRMMNNAGFAIGPAVGGFVAATSYHLTFLAGATGMLIYSGLLFFLARETLKRARTNRQSAGNRSGKITGRESVAGYGRVFRDGKYLTFIAVMSLGLTAPGMLWVLLAVYTKSNFGLPENLFGWIPTTNALMCVFVQYMVTRVTRRYSTLPVLAAGMLIYAVGVGSVALMSGFWGFWISMVVLTFGELTLVPTASKFVADLAPADMRGRYMSLYWLAWGLSRAAAPLIGGALNDHIGPRAIWVGGLLIGLTSVLGLVVLGGLGWYRQPAGIASEAEA
jgi:MFS family permease